GSFLATILLINTYRSNALLQVQLLDFLNGETGLNSGFPSCVWTALPTIASTYNRTDFGQLVSRARVLRIAYQALTTLHSIVEESTHTLYPWVPDHFKSIRNMQTTWESGGDGWNVLNCSLPIEVHHAGPGDLSTDMIDVLKSIRNEGTKIVGWAIKPFAILASKFRPVRLLTDSKIFKQYGQLFYPDRTIGRGDAKWFRNVTRHPTNFVKTLRYMNRKSSHEMESGVVVGIRLDRVVLYGLFTDTYHI
ncbi:hypothetical protein BCR33DRAFT_714822, partial [Rhizoclosmatium globosum]